MNNAGRHARFLRLALRLAGDSSHSTKHAAVVVRHGRVLAKATNRRRNDPTILSFPPGIQSVHAEVRALARVARPQDCTVYVARLRSNGSAGLSEPCEACWEALREAGVKRVLWTQEDLACDGHPIESPSLRRSANDLLD